MWEEVVKGPSPSLPLGLRLILYDPHINNPLVLQPLVTGGIFHFYHSIPLPNILLYSNMTRPHLGQNFDFFLLLLLDCLASCVNWPWSYSMWLLFARVEHLIHSALIVLKAVKKSTTTVRTLASLAPLAARRIWWEGGGRIMQAPAGLQPTMWNYANLVDFVKQCETMSSSSFNIKLLTFWSHLMVFRSVIWQSETIKFQVIKLSQACITYNHLHQWQHRLQLNMYLQNRGPETNFAKA